MFRNFKVWCVSLVLGMVGVVGGLTVMARPVAALSTEECDARLGEDARGSTRYFRCLNEVEETDEDDIEDDEGSGATSGSSFSGSGSNCVETALFGTVCDNGNGNNIGALLGVVTDVLTAVVGAVAMVGIVIVGIQYLTAGGNEEQTRKAKRRLFEIVIGLVAYVLAYGLLKWLLPGFG